MPTHIQVNKMASMSHIRCEQCKTLTPASDIRYVVVDGEKKALCSNCNMPKKAAEDPKRLKVPYFCERCKYRFLYNPYGEVRLRCPLCGQDDEIVKVRTGAEHLEG